MNSFRKRATKSFVTAIIFLSVNTLFAQDADDSQYRAFLEEKKSMLEQTSLNRWQPLYETIFEMMMRDVRAVAQLATNAEELARARERIEKTEIYAEDVADCFRTNMAFEFPSISSTDVEEIIQALDPNNYMDFPFRYASSYDLTAFSCTSELYPKF